MVDGLCENGVYTFLGTDIVHTHKVVEGDVEIICNGRKELHIRIAHIQFPP